MRWVLGMLVAVVAFGCGASSNKSAEAAKKHLLDIINSNRDTAFIYHSGLAQVAQEWADYHKDELTPAPISEDAPPPGLLQLWQVDNLLERVQKADQNISTCEGRAIIINSNSIQDAYDTFENTWSGWLSGSTLDYIGIGYSTYTDSQYQKQCYCWVIILGE